MKQSEIEGKNGLSRQQVLTNGQKFRATTLKGTGKYSYVTFSTIMENDKYLINKKFVSTIYQQGKTINENIQEE